MPFLHRFNDVAGALTLSISENIGLFVLTYILGTESRAAHTAICRRRRLFRRPRPWTAQAHPGPHRRRPGAPPRGLGLVHAGAGLLHAQPYELDDLYITAVVTTTTVVAVVVDYAFRLAEQAPGGDRHLLHNILPAPIVDRLKGAPGAIIADELADASVLFADLKGFVPLAKRLGPARTVGLLNIVVSAFDDLADQWRVEKIKTIGDAYMAAAGVPEPVADHAERLAGMALAMQATLARISREQDVALALRIGIATGPVLAGVIGARRLTYDVWGDTVNLASRLEGQSQPGRVLVSHATKTHLEPRFALELSGPFEIKGYGQEEAWTRVYVLAALPDASARADSAPSYASTGFRRARRAGLTVTVPDRASYPRRDRARAAGSAPHADFRHTLRRQEIRRGQGPAHGLHRRRRRAGDRVPARQPHVVLSVAQRHAALRRPRAASSPATSSAWAQRQARPSVRDRYGYAEQRDYLLRCGRSWRWATRSCWSSTTGLGAGLLNGRAQSCARGRHRLHGGDCRPAHLGDWPERARGAFQGFRADGGEDMILAKNMFVERILPGSILRKLADEEMAEYRRPFASPARTAAPR